MEIADKQTLAKQPENKKIFSQTTKKPKTPLANQRTNRYICYKFSPWQRTDL